mmetsp:Transcript_12821/g.15686  ORF Transcript_12821/g.15686 Transcript_12821/m.15686 type:complete len:85 (+) Transcript_12821:195-449(+)
MIPPPKKRGHGRKGVGTIVGFKFRHYVYVYELYKRNPSRTLTGYVEKLEGKYDIVPVRIRKKQELDQQEPLVVSEDMNNDSEEV